MKSPLNEDYELIGGVSITTSVHYSCFITKICINKGFTENFDIGKTYYNEWINNNGYFLKYKDFNELFSNNINLVPYII